MVVFAGKAAKGRGPGRQKLSAVAPERSRSPGHTGPVGEKFFHGFRYKIFYEEDGYVGL